jgi:TPR repeat protein
MRPVRRETLAALIAAVALAHDARAAAPENAGAGGLSERVRLARAYEHGEGVPKDPLKAAALYCEAAREGDADGQYGLGWMYAMGRGVARDDAVAASLLALAAGAGHAGAAKVLRFVDHGRGPLPDCMGKPEPAWADDEPVAEDAPDPFADLPPWKRRIADLVAVLAPRYTVEPRLALALIQVESNFEPRAVSVKNARGLMQLVPETASRFNVANPFDVRENVRGGLAYLRWLLAYYEGRVPLVAAAYNAGEGAVDRYRGIPPYPETRDYVRRVLRLYPSEQHGYDPRVAAPSPILATPDAALR